MGIRLLESSRQQLAAGSPDLAAEPNNWSGRARSFTAAAKFDSMVFANDPEITNRVDAVEAESYELDSAKVG